MGNSIIGREKIGNFKVTSNYCEKYHERDDYSVCQLFTNFGGFPMWNTLYTSKATGEEGRKECNEWLKQKLYNK